MLIPSFNYEPKEMMCVNFYFFLCFLSNELSFGTLLVESSSFSVFVFLHISTLVYGPPDVQVFVLFLL